MEEIQELEMFFCGLKIPKEPIRISKAEVIIDPEKFIQSHINIFQNYVEKQDVIQVYIERLRKLKVILEEKDLNEE